MRLLSERTRIREGVAMTMSDSVYDDDDDATSVDSGDGPRQLREALKAANAAKAEAERIAAEAQQQLEQTRRQQAFADAGIDTASPQGKFFADHYEGPIEEIQAKAAEIGLIKSVSEPQVDAHEQQAWTRSAAVSTSGTGSGVEDDRILEVGDSPQVIAEKMRRAGYAVASVTADAGSGGVWMGIPKV